jgi:hypothetical protein
MPIWHCALSAYVPGLESRRDYQLVECGTSKNAHGILEGSGTLICKLIFFVTHELTLQIIIPLPSMKRLRHVFLIYATRTTLVVSFLT